MAYFQRLQLSTDVVDAAQFTGLVGPAKMTQTQGFFLHALQVIVNRAKGTCWHSRCD